MSTVVQEFEKATKHIEVLKQEIECLRSMHKIELRRANNLQKIIDDLQISLNNNDLIKLP